MGTEGHTVTLLSPQADIVWEVLERDGTAFSKRDYVRKKYEESAKIFIAAYDAYVREASKIVPLPDGAEYPYWAFADKDAVDAGARVMTLSVPAEEAVFFDRFEWYRVLQLGYLGKTQEETDAFTKELERRGIRNESDVVLTAFYPDLKKKVTDSWKNLFRFHEQIRAGDFSCVRSVQAGLWRIDRAWLVS